MGMREDCKQFESRSYPNGDTVRKCNLDLAPEAPWRCPADCASYERRRVDVNWSYGTLVTPKTPAAPKSLDDDQDGSIAKLLDEAEDIVNQAGPEILAELEAEDRKSRRAAAKLAGAGGRAAGRATKKERKQMKKELKDQQRRNKKRGSE